MPLEVSVALPLVNYYPGVHTSNSPNDVEDETVVDDYMEVVGGAKHTQMNRGSNDRLNFVEMLMFRINGVLAVHLLGCVCYTLNDGRLTIAFGRTGGFVGGNIIRVEFRMNKEIARLLGFAMKRDMTTNFYPVPTNMMYSRPANQDPAHIP